MTAAFLGISTLTEATEVEVLVVAGTADAADFSADPATFTVSIPAGATSGTASFMLTALEDTTVDPDETVTVSATAPAEFLLLLSDVTLTITDDDTDPTGITLVLSSTEVPEGSSGGTTTTAITVTASFSGGTAGAVRATATEVTVSVAGVSATGAGTDFADVTAFSVTIDALATSGSATFDLVVTGDTLVEGDETLTVSGSADLAVAPATLTITDDDTAGVTITPTTLTVTEGAAVATYMVVLDSAPAVSATVTIDPGTSTMAPITVTPPSLALTFSSTDWETAQTVTVTATEDDDTLGGTRTLLHTVSGYGDVATAADVTVTVIDNDTDGLPEIFLFSTVSRVTEASGTTRVTVNVSLPVGSDRSNAVPVTLSVVGVGDNPATAGADFDRVEDFTINIPVASLNGQGTFDLVVTDDMLVEGIETLRPTGSVNGYTVDSSTTIRITDNDSANVTFHSSAVEVDEGDGMATLTVLLDNAVEGGLAVRARTRDIFTGRMRVGRLAGATTSSRTRR